MGMLDRKVAIVTGAARGQGLAEAHAFVREGAEVVLADVLDEEGRAAAEEIGAGARYVHLDVTEEQDWAAAVAQVTAEIGRVDVLVNNAGVARLTPLVGGSPEDYLRVVMVNQFGVYLGIRATAPAMAESGGGSIVNISSIDGLIGMAGVAAYVSSKFAVRGLTKVAALELAPLGIRANSVHPGFIDTPMLRPAGATDDHLEAFVADVPLGRLGTVDDIAGLVVFLASDASAYCTGAEFVIDGGLTAGFEPGRQAGTRRERRGPGEAV